jgi:hypothetical protein
MDRAPILHIDLQTQYGVAFLAPKEQRVGLSRTLIKSLAEFFTRFPNADEETKDGMRCMFSIVPNLVVDVIHAPEQEVQNG